MKVKKNMSPGVLQANRNNSQSSTGPRTQRGKVNSSRNALRHGILARKLELETDEQRLEFDELLQSVRTDRAPEGLIEDCFVEEIAILFWKLGIVGGLEAKELLRRQDLSDEVGGIFNNHLELPINRSDLPIDRSWDCDRIVVRAVAGEDKSHSNAARGPAVFQKQIISAVQKFENHNRQTAGHLEIEAVLGSTLEKMTRYQSALKRDLYRAIEMLSKMQAERREARVTA